MATSDAGRFSNSISGLSINEEPPCIIEPVNDRPERFGVDAKCKSEPPLVYNDLMGLLIAR